MGGFMMGEWSLDHFVRQPLAISLYLRYNWLYQLNKANIFECMGLPGKRLSRSSKRRRAAHFSLKKKVFVACGQCKKEIMPHTACPFCGTYKAREVLALRVPKALKAMTVPQKPSEEKAS